MKVVRILVVLGQGLRYRCCGFKLSNGYSPANLSNSSTRQNSRFQKYARLARLADIRLAVLQGLSRLAEICQVVLRGLARLADIRRAMLRGLARLAKGVFGKC